MKDNNGTSTIQLIGAQAADTGGRLEMSQANGQLTVVLDVKWATAAAVTFSFAKATAPDDHA